MRSNKTFWAIGLVGFFVLSTFGLIMARTLATKEPKKVKPTRTATAAPTPPPNKKFDGLIGLKLSRFGFEQTEIERPKGHQLIYVLNRSGIAQLSFQLDRLVGRGHLKEVALPATKGAWRDEIDLGPGEYRLSVVDHPDWTCHIIITP